MALSPARTHCTACAPVMAESAVTGSSPWRSSHSRAAPRLARVCSTVTRPRRRTTSLARYGRVMPCQRRSLAHWRSNAVMTSCVSIANACPSDELGEPKTYRGPAAALERACGARQLRAMRAPSRGASLLAAAALGCSAGAASPAAPGGLALEPVASGLSAPLYLTAPPGDTTRLFVVEQGGRVRIVAHGRLLAAPFLDLTARVSAGGERGLLSLAFHPDFAANGYVCVDYTDTNGDTRVERYTVSGDPDVADPASRKPILFVPQPYPNHNGGLVLFGPDGKLYIGLGDGGSGGDPENRAQNPDSLLGKLLRLDVDAGDPYAIPPDNPFARGGGAPEVWALGLRNPWRFAFDRASGLLYIADVGQDAWEEVDVAPAARSGANYGWRLMEGAHCYHPDPCSPAGLVPPALEYSHAEGCAVV